jgi:hypothetical protein
LDPHFTAARVLSCAWKLCMYIINAFPFLVTIKNVIADFLVASHPKFFLSSFIFCDELDDET